MTTILALATFGLEVVECGGHAPHMVRTIYYLTPHHPNCVIDIAPVWERKQRALSELGTQLAFSGRMYRQIHGEALTAIVPDYARMDDASLGRAVHRELDLAFHLYYGPPSHGRFMLAEPYRREGFFHLDALIV